MDAFTQFQLKEYENISQAHFKTNEVLATFYRHFLLIAAIPLTAVGIAMINLADNGIQDEGRFLAFIFFGVSTLLLSVVGAAVIGYIEGLRLDSILYARVVNSIRDYFFSLQGNDKFGEPVLPTDRRKPSYQGVGAGFIMYFACAILNASGLRRHVLYSCYHSASAFFGQIKKRIISQIRHLFRRLAVQLPNGLTCGRRRTVWGRSLERLCMLRSDGEGL